MVELSLALIVFLFPLAYSPGPGNIFFAANGARFGFRATIMAHSGYHIATWIITFSIGLGFIGILENFPFFFVALKIIGVTYVFFLAWKLYRSGALDGHGEARAVGFRGGAFLMLVNPKAYVIIALMFSQFLPEGGQVSFALVAWITTIFTFNNLLAFCIWTLIGEKITVYFTSPRMAKRLNTIFGGILALVAVWMLFS